MNFFEYVSWRVKDLFTSLRPCSTCRGSKGHCGKCNDWHNLYRKDLEKEYWKKFWERRGW